MYEYHELSSNSRITIQLLPEFFLPAAGAQTLGSDPRGSQAPAQPPRGCLSPQQSRLDCKGIPKNQKQKAEVLQLMDLETCMKSFFFFFLLDKIFEIDFRNSAN